MTDLRRRRSGSTTIAALITLSVVMSIVLSAMVATIRSDRERKVERQQIQLRFINESGALRAVHLWKTNPQFQGDEWTLTVDPSIEQLATIRSSIRTVDNGKLQVEVLSILDHPNPHLKMQLTKTYPLSFAKE